MKKLLLAALLLIPVMAFSGCANLDNAVDNAMGVNPKTGCMYTQKDCGQFVISPKPSNGNSGSQTANGVQN